MIENTNDDIRKFIADDPYYEGTTTNQVVYPPPTDGGSVPPPKIYGCTDPTAYNYDPSATDNDGSCISVPITPPPTKIAGCTDIDAVNYNKDASVDDGSCFYNKIVGCTDPTAANYNPSAQKDDGSCIPIIVLSPPPRDLTIGCRDANAINYDPLAVVEDNSLCVYPDLTSPQQIAGCTNSSALNYKPLANIDDGSCIFDHPIYGCANPTALNYNANATIDDGTCIFKPRQQVGCMDQRAVNYDASATQHDGTMCEYAPAPLAPAQEPPKFADTGLSVKINVIAYTPLRVDFVVVDPKPAGNISIEVLPIELNISPIILGLINAYISDSFDTFIDPERYFKLLLNYGDDKQTTIANYRLNSVDPRQLQLKLIGPVPSDISVNTPVFLGREVAKTFIDDVRIGFAPAKDRTPYLRPRNTKVKVPGNYKQSLEANLETLNLLTGSVGTLNNVATFEDSIFRKWYSYDWNSTELNEDFTDYKNFIFYSSAELRLAAFSEKVRRIERIQTQALQTSDYITTASVATGSFSTLAGPITLGTSIDDVTVVSGSLVGDALITASRTYALQIENIIRTLDTYERYLFYGPTNIPYSASVDYGINFTEFNYTAAWPKNSSGQLFSVDSPIAQDWITTQLEIAQRFDEQNVNSFAKFIPSHIAYDDESQSFITFVLAVGHFFDNIKSYVDQMNVNIYDRQFDPESGMSIDLVWEIAESFGVKLPNPYSIYTLQEYILPTESQDKIRVLSAETWKRLLNSLIFLLKARGTNTAVNSFLRILGIHPQLLSVKESEYNTSASFLITEEFSNGLEFSSAINSYIVVPMSSSLRDTKTLQLRFATRTPQNVTVANFDDSLALNIEVSASNTQFGRVVLMSGSQMVLSSSYETIFDNEFIDIMLRRYPSFTDLTVIRNDGEEILHSSSNISLDASVVTSWTASRNFFVGGSGSIKSVNNFAGVVDEVRAWGELIERDTFIAQTYDPGSYTGNTVTSSIQSLFTQLSFNKEFDLSTRFIQNESPYFNKNGVSDPFDVIARTNIEFIEVEGFISSESYTRFNRKVRINTPTFGGSTYTTSKVKVAPEPVFKDKDVIDGAPTLRVNRSIVSLEEKREKRATTFVTLAISPTDFQNQNISRAFGGFNINNLIGDPAEVAAPEYKKLKELQRLYSRHFYSKVDANRLIRIFETILDGMSDFIDFLMPIKARLQTGILIQPNILERTKVMITKRISVDGTQTRNSLASATTASLYAPSDHIYSLEETILMRDTSFKPSAQMNEQDSYDDYSIELPIEVGPKVLPANPESIAEMSYRTYDAPVELSDELQVSSDTSFIELFTSGVTYNLFDESPTISTQFNSPSKRTEDDGFFLGALFIENNAIRLDDVLTFVSKSNNPNSISENAYVTYNSGSEISTISNLFIGGKDFYGNYNIIGRKTEEQSVPTFNTNLSLDLFNISKFGVVFENNRMRFVTDGSGENYPFAIGISMGNDANGNPIDRDNINYLYDIGPSTDFSDLGVTTYFYKEDGLYNFPTINYKAIGLTTLKFLTGSYQTTRALSGSFAQWAYGESYTENDVVVQNISPLLDFNDPNNSRLLDYRARVNNQVQVITALKHQLVAVETEQERLATIDQLRTEEARLTAFVEAFNKVRDLLRSATAGNRYFYRFKKKTSTGPVSSYIPPALDKEKWELLLYVPILSQQPRRVLLDTDALNPITQILSDLTVVDPRVTGDVFGRTEFDSRTDLTTGPNQTIVGAFNIANVAELLALKFESRFNFRITLYRTANQRDLDVLSNREFGAEPTGDHGVLFDALVNDLNYNILNPSVRLVNGDESPTNSIYYRITNLEANTKTFRLKMYLYVYEGPKKVPLGYLPRHYKFSRDNSTATKRRNYIGCLQTQDTTTDGLSPVEVTLSSGTDITVLPTSPNDSIILGGGGTLNVT